MPIRVDAYLTGGMARGMLARPGHLRDTLEAGPSLDLQRVSWLGIADAQPRTIDDVSIPVDDVLIAVADDDPTIPVHAAWHRIELDVGPYRLEGELPTLPGFDPGRALTRPTGEFVMLRDVRLARRDHPGQASPIGGHALVNRYNVDRVTADLMLGFFFPGAVIDGLPAETGTADPAKV